MTLNNEVFIRSSIKWVIVRSDIPRLAYLKAQELVPEINFVGKYIVFRPNRFHNLQEIAGFVNPPYDQKEDVDKYRKKRIVGVYGIAKDIFFVYIDMDLFPQENG